jgi:hypothetical protein
MAVIRYLGTKSPHQLLNLPKELRDMIWCNVLMDKDEWATRYPQPFYEDWHFIATPTSSWKLAKGDMSLLLVKRQIRKECARLFYC